MLHESLMKKQVKCELYSRTEVPVPPISLHDSQRAVITTIYECGGSQLCQSILSGTSRCSCDCNGGRERELLSTINQEGPKVKAHRAGSRLVGGRSRPPYNGNVRDWRLKVSPEARRARLIYTEIKNISVNIPVAGNKSDTFRSEAGVRDH
ncbi:hypothetical protein EVAR_63253_1 [Eumeta japonica]|uniref:Uncharacterized protein n=1 Tax=Eumeta variegata TaxID=151549 RepID=A0A4C2A0Q4_EUMVA|nr:hypothetical protein EVAR_63253_1 [Eumeta japonica]